MILALYDAYQAGREQGSEEATAYEWGQNPRYNEQEMFEDLFREWETGYAAKSHIRKALRRCT